MNVTGFVDSVAYSLNLLCCFPIATVPTFIRRATISVLQLATMRRADSARKLSLAGVLADDIVLDGTGTRYPAFMTVFSEGKTLKNSLNVHPFRAPRGLLQQGMS